MDASEEYLRSSKGFRVENPLLKGNWEGLAISLACGLYSGKRLEEELQLIKERFEKYDKRRG